MIQLLKDYFDKKGNRYKVISFSNGKYKCQSYSTGKISIMAPNELFESKRIEKQVDRTPVKTVEIKKIRKDTREKISEPEYVMEPEYFSPEPEYEINEGSENVLSYEPKDNNKETADIYADL